MKNERKKVEEKGVKKREKWEKCPRGYAPSIARYLKNEFLEVLDLDFSALRAGYVMRSRIFRQRGILVRRVCWYVLTLRYCTTSAPFGQKLRFCTIPLRALGGFAVFLASSFVQRKRMGNGLSERREDFIVGHVWAGKEGEPGQPHF